MVDSRRLDERSDGGDNRVRLYNPYKDLHVPYKNIYNLPTSPEFLFQEEAIVQRRSWGENLTYYTGCGYLAGAISGGGKGLANGIKAIEAADTWKVRINRVLNSSGQTGRRFANHTGVIGLIYAGLESGTIYLRDTDDMANSVLAGLGTGALFKAASGLRSAAVGGAIGGLMVGVVVGSKQILRRYVPI